MSAVVWLRGTWPEHQAKMVAAALEASGMTVQILPVGIDFRKARWRLGCAMNAAQLVTNEVPHGS